MAYATIYVAPGVVTDMRFPYTCTGTEGDEFAISFPTTRADINYIATVTLLSSAGAQYLLNAPQSGYTTTGITVIAGVPVHSGDVLSIVVQERTS